MPLMYEHPSAEVEPRISLGSVIVMRARMIQPLTLNHILQEDADGCEEEGNGISLGGLLELGENRTH